MKHDAGTLLDIYLAAEDVINYSLGMAFDDFRANRQVQDAILYRLGVIGEAVKRLSEEFRNGHPEIPWKSIAGMRDRIFHAYDQVDLRSVWHVVEKEIPHLRTFIKGFIHDGK